MKITIHRALSELKLIDAKIEKEIVGLTPMGIYQKGKLISGYITPEAFEKTTASQYQSVTDLITRKQLIKAAIVQANATTLVSVGGKEMTIAGAITFKTIIAFKKKLIERLKAVHRVVIADFNKNNEIVKNNVQKLLEAALGKENIKTDSKDVEAVSAPYMAANEFHLFDPIKVLEKIEHLEKEVSEFEAEVDATLSEVNSITFIEV